jgi:type I restriction enzyme S subunit
LKRYTGDYKKRHVIEAGDLIVTNTEQGFDFLLIGYPAIVPKRFGSTGLFSHHLYRVRPRPESPVTTQFLYQLLLTPLVREQVIGCTNGTTVNMLALDGLEMPRFVLPPPALIKEFDRIAIPLYERSETNFDESETLVSLRDTLLPKLLSGEIRVDAKVRAAVGVQEGR